MCRTVEIYTAKITQPEIRERCRLIYPKLPVQEREKAGRFVYEADRLRFITGRLLIREIFKERFGTAFAEIKLTEYGKPYITGAENFHFNLSHSGDFVALAVSNAPVGIDIEQIKEIEWKDIAQTFSAKEKSMLNNSSGQLNCFYRIWTVREAFSKEEGTGLSLFEDTDNLPEFDYSNGTIKWNGKNLCFYTKEMEGHILSVCCQYNGYISTFMT